MEVPWQVGQWPHWQDHSPPVLKQGKQSKSSEGNQDQSPVQQSPEKTIVTRQVQSQTKKSNQQGKVRISKIRRSM